MPFIQRDQDNKIITIFDKQCDQAQEELSVNNDEIIEYLKSKPYKNQLLQQSDTDFVRVLEDLIDLLLDKHVFLLTDLPASAQEKVLRRKKIRKEYIQSILSDDEDIF